MCGITQIQFVMRKVFILVVLFLGGITTQAVAQKKDHKNFNNGINHRYYNPESVRFVEDGILFTVYTDGTFNFTNQFNGSPYFNGRRNHQVANYGKRRGHLRKRGWGNRPLYVKNDYFGNVILVNNVRITYQRNGKVAQIGCVPIVHRRGLLRQVGGMTLEYNRFREIRNAYGFVNRYNQQFWHENWYVYNDHGNYHYRNDDWDDEDEVWEGRRDRSK